MTQPAKLKVINLFGPPGVGKSSVRSGVFWLMKSYGLSVEEVSEYAKYLVLRRCEWQLREEQLYLLAQQHHKQFILRGRYEYAVTDSPLALCDFYSPPGKFASFSALINDLTDTFENINFYLTRDLVNGHFEEEGRMHDRQAALRVDAQMRKYLAERRISYIEMPIDLLTPWRILDHLLPGVAPFPSFPSA